MYIGSGDTTKLLAGKDTRGHLELLQRFVSDVKPNFNAKSSPIDALRTGAILEERYISQFDDTNYYPQVLCVSPEMDVFICHLDIAELTEGVVTNFIEVKSVGFIDFQEMLLLDNDELLKHVRKAYKTYYNQIQEQLFCTNLGQCELHFIQVLSYDDTCNYERIISNNEVIKCQIRRDEEVISKLRERGKVFQILKDYYCKN